MAVQLSYSAHAAFVKLAKSIAKASANDPVQRDLLVEVLPGPDAVTATLVLTATDAHTRLSALGRFPCDPDQRPGAYRVNAEMFYKAAPKLCTKKQNAIPVGVPDVETAKAAVGAFELLTRDARTYPVLPGLPARQFAVLDAAELDAAWRCVKLCLATAAVEWDRLLLDGRDPVGVRVVATDGTRLYRSAPLGALVGAPEPDAALLAVHGAAAAVMREVCRAADGEATDIAVHADEEVAGLRLQLPEWVVAVTARREHPPQHDYRKVLPTAGQLAAYYHSMTLPRDALAAAIDRLGPATKRNQGQLEWRLAPDGRLMLTALSSACCARVQLPKPVQFRAAPEAVADAATKKDPTPYPYTVDRSFRVSSRFLLDALECAGGDWELRWASAGRPMIWGAAGAAPEYASTWLVMPISLSAPCSAWEPLALAASKTEENTNAAAPAEPAATNA